MDTTYLVIGGTGRTGRRVTRQLLDTGHRARVTSRGGTPPFDWHEPDTWAPAVTGARRAYLAFSPDISMPGADDLLGEFARVACDRGLQRVVLLSGRGEAAARRAEQRVTDVVPEWTVLRSSFFMQDFSEHFWLDAVRRRLIALPAGQTGEPFVDIEDLAAVAVQALTTDDLLGRTLELTGPRLLTFDDVAAELTDAVGDPVRYLGCTVEEFVAGAIAGGMPEPEARLLAQVFAQVLDGRNAHLTGDLERALGRPGRDFAGYARDVAASGAWSPVPQPSQVSR